ncbi:hypothetical protein ACH5RR_021465 [Cinchona calisaya]|uniref:Uncharacterized protein n=1 Tax=Cinchona calisaya TaxID=153742 RepID=A0ABD2ZJ57_9GENT
MCANTFPTIHYSDATLGKVFMAYSIMIQQSVNLGKTITKEIIAMAVRSVGSLEFTLLIISPCLQACVEWTDEYAVRAILPDANINERCYHYMEDDVTNAIGVNPSRAIGVVAHDGGRWFFYYY